MTNLQQGDKAPNFEGVDQDGKAIKLEDYKGKKLILFFYPKDNTPTCTVEVCHFRDNYELLTKLGFALLGVSPDSEKRHQNFINKHNLPYPLLADTEKKAIEAYGIWGPKKFMGRTSDALHRTTFIIDGEGMIERVFHPVKSKEHTVQILKSYV